MICKILIIFTVMILVRSNFLISLALWWFLVNIWTESFNWKVESGHGEEESLTLYGPGLCYGLAVNRVTLGEFPALCASPYFTDDFQGLFSFITVSLYIRCFPQIMLKCWIKTIPTWSVFYFAIITVPPAPHFPICMCHG